MTNDILLLTVAGSASVVFAGAATFWRVARVARAPRRVARTLSKKGTATHKIAKRLRIAQDIAHLLVDRETGQAPAKRQKMPASAAPAAAPAARPRSGMRRPVMTPFASR